MVGSWPDRILARIRALEEDLSKVYQKVTSPLNLPENLQKVIVCVAIAYQLSQSTKISSM